jgi:hypothetical protein
VRTHSSRWLNVIAFAASLALISAASAEQAAKPDIAQQLQAVADKAIALTRQPGQTKALADLFYEDDLTITGEGFGKYYPNLASFTEPLAEATKNPSCNLHLLGKPQSSGRLATAWFTEHCDAYKDMPAEDYVTLYVWRKGPKGWRVTMESVTAGKLVVAK